MSQRGGRRNLKWAARAAALLAVCLSAAAQQQQRTPVYTNPVVAGDFPDPSVIRVGVDYWATATSGGWAPHFPVLHSRDLVNWRTVGHVFERRPRWAKGDFWAPEIVHDRGRFYVFYTARRDEGQGTGTLCVAVATAARPEGPYTDHGPLACEIRERGGVGSIDAAFVRDERGDPYLVWKADGNDAEPDQPTSIYAQRLSEDGTRLVGRRAEILRNTEGWERHVTEGSYVLRRGEWFYHFYSGNACCGRGCDYALGVARARRLLGPWEKHPDGPILDDNAEWQCPGHGTVVSTPDGRDFMLYHSYRRRADTFNVGREALLDEIVWGADGWPRINGGRGPSTSAPSPLGAEESDDEAAVNDEFDGARLNPEWQWPISSEQQAAAEGGWLVLTQKGRGRAEDPVGAVVARRTRSGGYEATTRVGLRGTPAISWAGLAAYSWRERSVGVGVGGGRVIVWRREGKELRTVAAADLPPSTEFVRLRMTAAGGESYRFAYAAGGQDWRGLGGEVNGAHVEGARVALTVGGGAGAAARFDFLTLKSGSH